MPQAARLLEDDDDALLAAADALIAGRSGVPGRAPASSGAAEDPGLLEPGNIDLVQQPRVRNADGTVSTVRSISANIDGREVLIPTVSPDGRILSDQDAIAEFRRTGRHLGAFDNPANATAFAQRLHDAYAAGRYDRPTPTRTLDPTDPDAELLASADALISGQKTGPSVDDLQAQKPMSTEAQKRAAPDRRSGRTLSDLILDRPAPTPPASALGRAYHGFARGFDAVTTPLLPAEAARTAANVIEGTEVGRPTVYRGGVLDAIAAVPDVVHYLRERPLETARAYIGGGVEGLATLTDPVTVVTTVLGLGAESQAARSAVPAIGRIARGVGIAADAAQVARGAGHVAEGDSASERAGGIAQMALGAAGLRASTMRQGSPIRGVAQAAAEEPPPLPQRASPIRLQEEPPPLAGGREVAPPPRRIVGVARTDAAAAADDALLRDADALIGRETAPAASPVPARRTSTLPDEPTAAAPVARVPGPSEATETAVPPKRAIASEQARPRPTADQVFDAARTQARADGYTGDDAALRERFDDLVESVRDVEREGHEDPRDILRAVADYGGLALTDKDLGGELRWLGEFRDRQGRGAFGTIGGVANVLRRPQRGVPGANRTRGISPDYMLEKLQQDPRFAHFERPGDVIEAIADAKRQIDAGGVGPGSGPVEVYADIAGIRPGQRWWQRAPETDADSFEHFARGWDDIAAQPAYGEPGERGNLIVSLGPNPRPIRGTEVRSPNTRIEGRFEAPSTSRTFAARARKTWEGVRRSLGRTFTVEYDLRKAGLDEAVDRLEQFNRDRLEAPKQVMDDLQGVLGDLKRPEQYHLFQRIVMLRRDLELADAMQQGRIPKRDLENGLTPLEARTELDRLTALAQREPEILAATDKHRALVKRVGDDLVDRGLMRADTRDRNAEYFPGLVLDQLERGRTLVDRPVSPLTPGPRGFLKQARGGARATVRDYMEAMGQHLADVRRATMRDDLVKDLARGHDWSTAGSHDGPIPDGYAVWHYGSEAYVLPTELRKRLVKFTATKPEELRAMNQVTNWWKSATLRVLGLPYEMLNAGGDLVNFAAGEPLRDLPKAPRRLYQAARASRKLAPWQRNDPQHAARLQLEQIADLGDRLNLGTGAATADLSQAVRQTPQLREIRRPLDQSTAKSLALLPRDAYRRAVAMQDKLREFRESIPRRAKFMAEIERGQTPEVAAAVTRRELIDYTALTDVERTWLRGIVMPFYTFAKKNAELWVPGLRTAANGSRVAGAGEAASRIAKVMIPAYLAALYNETYFGDVERKLPDYDRNRFHLLFPWKSDGGRDGVLYIGFTGPANAAAGFVGLQGATQRSLDLARGRTTIGEEVRRSGQQVRESVLGLVSPILSEPVEQLTNRDLRTGREIVPSDRSISAGEAAKLRAQHVAGRFAPVSQVTRSASETTGLSETLGELGRRLIGGNLVKVLDVDRLNAQVLDRAVAAGEHRAADDRAAVRAGQVDVMRGALIKAGPERAAAVLEEAWREANGDDRAILLRAVRAAADEDRRFSTLLAKLRTANRSVSESEAPYIAEELRRRGLGRQ